MQRAVTATFGLCAALVLCPAALSQGVAAQATLAQDLTLRGPGEKAQVVLWTRRDKYCTLQFVFPADGAATFIGRTIAELRSQGPQRPQTTPPPPQTAPTVQAWLLRADGSVIQRVENPERSTNGGVMPNDVQFTYPLSAAREAVAAAMRIDDSFFIKPLQPLSD